MQTVFLKNTVREELEEAGADADALPFDLTPLYERHPYDLSGGEQQLTALAKVLAKKFADNFKRFETAPEELVKAGPVAE